MATQPLDSQLTQAQWSEFLAKNTLIPLSLVTITRLKDWRENADTPPMLRDPQNTTRGAKTIAQSDCGKRESNYKRVSVGGLPIQDNGFQLMEGVMELNELQNVVSLFEVAKFISVDEGRGQTNRKVELRRKNFGDTEGNQDIEQIRRSLLSVPAETRVSFVIWCNPDGNGWLRFNLVLRSWSQEALAESPLTHVGVMEIDGIPTIDLEPHGFTF